MGHFSGTIYDRIDGLKNVFEVAFGQTVLDLGCNCGLVAYELSKYEPKAITGIDRDQRDIQNARRIFERVPVESRFMCKDVFEAELQPHDIVLFLGLWHHLDTGPKFDTLLQRIVDATKDLLVVRSNEAVGWLPDGFELVEALPATKVVGALRVYKRITK